MGTRFLCLLFKFLVLLHFDTVVDVFPASVSQNDSSVVGLACFRGVELLHIRLAGFKERGGNLRGKSGLAFLEKAVILPHDKGTFFVAAIIVFLPLMDGGTATGAFADRGLFLPEQILFPVQCCGVCLQYSFGFIGYKSFRKYLTAPPQEDVLAAAKELLSQQFQNLRVQPVPERKNPSLKSVAAMLPVLLLKVCHSNEADGSVHIVPVDCKPLDIASSYNPFLLCLIFHILTIFTISVKFVVALV